MPAAQATAARNAAGHALGTTNGRIAHKTYLSPRSHTHGAVDARARCAIAQSTPQDVLQQVYQGTWRLIPRQILGRVEHAIAIDIRHPPESTTVHGIGAMIGTRAWTFAQLYVSLGA